MKKINELLSEMGLGKAREFVAHNAIQYRTEVHSLIADQIIEGICFGRCFFLIITDLGELQFQYVRGCNDALC